MRNGSWSKANERNTLEANKLNTSFVYRESETWNPNKSQFYLVKKKVRKKTCKSESWSTHTIPTLMNLQRQRRCPRDELAAECELPPRGEGANKTQHNTNKPAQLVRASQPASRSAGRPAGLAAEPHMVQWRGICGPMQERTAAEPSNMYFYPIRFTSSRLKNFPELSSFWLTFKENCWNSLHCQFAAPTYNYKAIMVWGHTCM